MTNKEAINLLDNLIGMVEDNHDSDYDGALRLAINALEKQIPKTPVGEYCPNCKKYGVYESDGYYRNGFCSLCGQRLLWEDE